MKESREAMTDRKCEDDSYMDFYRYRMWQMTLTGYSPSSNILYYIYRASLMLLLVTFQILAFYACSLIPKKTLIINTAHHSLVAFCAIWAISSRLITYKSLEKTREMINSGIYVYEEELDEDQLKMKERVREEIKRGVRNRSNLCFLITTGAYISNMIYYPVTQYLFTEAPESEPQVNPYLPHFFYTPFSTWTPLGFALAYIYDCIYYFFLYAAVLSMNGIYAGCTIHLKTQFELLNYSIRNIQRRAYVKYKSISNDESNQKTTSTHKVLKADLLEREEFQMCLYSCLKSNIQHHQALLRFAKYAQPFCGGLLLLDFTMAAAINATTLYLIYQQPPPHLLTNLIGTFIAEQIYTFTVCYYAEQTHVASQELFQALYSIAWFHYNDRFNQILGIMMSNTIKPLTLKTLLLGIPGCLETFGDLLSGTYKLMSLVRQSDVLD